MKRNIEQNPEHPGTYIRVNVLPKGMNVTKAALLLGIGRPAFSNLLNGKAALSADMAARIEVAFGESARKLINKQIEYDSFFAKHNNISATAKSFVPPYLQFKAKDFENWTDSITSRHRLPVLLRILINSTCQGLEKIEFPGNDDAEKSGWDGFVHSAQVTPWIPKGKSGWEFGVRKDIKLKADEDYSTRVALILAKERKDITFVFVTPRHWDKKELWENQRRAEKKWKDVKVIDAIDLEQWMEQSIESQIWFAEETGMETKGVFTLDACWKKWIVDCEPSPSEVLFDEAVKRSKEKVNQKLFNSLNESLIITSDSTEEALAYLFCLFTPENPELFMFRDSIIVFKSTELLEKLVSKPVHFIAVTANREVEKVIAQHKQNLRSILIYPRNTTNVEADIELDTLSNDLFKKALRIMGCNPDDVNRLAYESGRSLTILRRRLSKSEAIRIPQWSKDNSIFKSLIPILFAGSWKTTNDGDRIVMEALLNELKYIDLEKDMAGMLQLEDSPVWTMGEFCGLVSKIDVLFAINKEIIKDELFRFLEIASKVLSENDPSLDLPEDIRWAASLRGKVRQISVALREGICETLVLLAIYGNKLFRTRLGIDLEFEINRLIEKLLTPLTLRVLANHSADLPMYSEAAPSVFIELLERDLDSDDPKTIHFMKPMSTGLFGRLPRAGLLWALENLAWSSEYVHRIVLILGRLSQIEIHDNWSNKPQESLSSIFRSWLPQTSVTVDKRIGMIDLLVNKFPDVGWRICIEQFNGVSRMGNFNHKPRWRTEGNGYGESATNKEFYKFVRYSLDKAINWKFHNHITIGDLVSCIHRLEEEDRTLIWKLVQEWSKNATENKNYVREIIRVNYFTRKSLKRDENTKEAKQDLKMAKAIYDSLQPNDLILRHEWLFNKYWILESEEDAAEELDNRSREERILEHRKEALKEIFATYGIKGILKLAEIGEAALIIGLIIPKVFEKIDQQIEVFQNILDHVSPSDSIFRTIVSNALNAINPDQAKVIISALIKNLNPSEIDSFLTICPFNQSTWDLLNSMNQEVQNNYWKNIVVRWGIIKGEFVQFPIEKLLEADRPKAAFELALCELDKIQPRQLFRILESISSSTSKPSDTDKIDHYSIQEAFVRLNESKEIAIDEMAGLEFRYIEVFQKDYKIPNLENHIEANPELFVQAVVYAYKRDDKSNDYEEFHSFDNGMSNPSILSFLLLDKLARIPGRNQLGESDSTEIEKWVNQVRLGCKQYGREKICDLLLGKLFAHASLDEDGVWPCRPVRETLEKIMTETLSNGINIALFYRRGIHIRGEGGTQERELASKYRNWSQALEYTHPSISKTLKKMVETYEKKAILEDENAVIKKRLLK